MTLIFINFPAALSLAGVSGKISPSTTGPNGPAKDPYCNRFNILVTYLQIEMCHDSNTNHQLTLLLTAAVALTISS